MNITINKNKNIGKVIFVVEGDVDEPNLIISIFNKLFNYTVIKYMKNNNEIIKLENNNNKYSKVFVIPARDSAISKLNLDDDYFIDLFVRLDSYDLDIDNSALYFLFDRDRDSNRPTPIKKNIDKYYNSRDNNSYRNGLFLLSFPSIQAFYLNCKNDTNEFYNGNAIKNYCKNLDMTLSNDELINGTKTFINIIKGITGNFNIDLLDNFKNTNKKIFEFNETYFFENKAYKTLSLLFVSLLDLNLITIND